MPAGSVAADVGIVALVNDVGLLAAPADGTDIDDVLDEGGGAVLPAEVVVDELLPGDETTELVDDGSSGAVGACANRSEIPLAPSTDPVWTLEIRLHGVAFVLGGAGV